jgi:transposase InsO family protein
MTDSKDGSKKRKSDYVPEPEVPEEIRARYATILEVISGAITMADGARRLGLSRNRFQTLVHRAQAGMIEELAPKPAGRPKEKSDQERSMIEEMEKLKKENERLQGRIETFERLLGVAGDLLRGRQSKRTGRNSRSKTSTSTSTTSTSSDAEEERRQRLAEIREARALGLPAELAAALAGISPATAARWARQEKRGETLVKKRGPGEMKQPPPAELVKEVENHVRELKGLVGAESLRHTFSKLSRREAAAIKAEALTVMERERKESCPRVAISAPGIIRGFDAMHVRTTAGKNYLLACADACVPYRTTVEPAVEYCSHAVADILERDFIENGPPLVLRLDRASVHRAPEVAEVATRFGVILLHGPPRHPRYYGQLERQNREHRAWLEAVGLMSLEQLLAECGAMQAAFNARWRRGTLGFRTASELWNERTAIVEDRDALRMEVEERRARLLRSDVAMDLAERLAIEQTLIEHNYLSIENRGRR